MASLGSQWIFLERPNTLRHTHLAFSFPATWRETSSHPKLKILFQTILGLNSSPTWNQKSRYAPNGCWGRISTWLGPTHPGWTPRPESLPFSSVPRPLTRQWPSLASKMAANVENPPEKAPKLCYVYMYQTYMPPNVCNIEQLQLDTFSFISTFSNDSLARRAIINMKTSMNMGKALGLNLGTLGVCGPK